MSALHVMITFFKDSVNICLRNQEFVATFSHFRNRDNWVISRRKPRHFYTRDTRFFVVLLAILIGLVMVVPRLQLQFAVLAMK